METKPQPTPNNSEEIDLGQLFKLIGNAFNKFFNFIGSILKALFHGFIRVLLFIQKHAVKLALAGIVGVLAGFALDIYRGPLYQSTMVLEPNFNSVQQLYNNINFYNELAKAEDSVALAEALEIQPSEAATIKELSVDSYADDNQKVKLFNDFITSLDTSVQKNIDIEKYLENFNSFDARFHTVTIYAENSMVAKKTQPAIISSIARNDYFKIQKNIADINIELQDSLIKQQLVEIDSLQLLYKRVMEKEADKPLQGTNISLGENGMQQNKELALLNQIDDLKANLVQLNQQRANNSNILNVISDFPRQGVQVKGFWKSYKFVLPVLLVTLTLLVLGLLELNRYLLRYKEESLKN